MQTAPADTIVYGLTWIPVLAVLLTLCGAVALTNARVLQTRLLATAISFGAVMVVGVNVSPIFALGIAVFAILTLMGMVSQNA
jgi:hypothetical protein